MGIQPAKHDILFIFCTNKISSSMQTRSQSTNHLFILKLLWITELSAARVYFCSLCVHSDNYSWCLCTQSACSDESSSFVSSWRCRACVWITAPSVSQSRLPLLRHLWWKVLLLTIGDTSRYTSTVMSEDGVHLSTCTRIAWSVACRFQTKAVIYEKFAAVLQMKSFV